MVHDGKSCADVDALVGELGKRLLASEESERLALRNNEGLRQQIAGLTEMLEQMPAGAVTTLRAWHEAKLENKALHADVAALREAIFDYLEACKEIERSGDKIYLTERIGAANQRLGLQTVATNPHPGQAIVEEDE